jgi:hypothetical protein
VDDPPWISDLYGTAGTEQVPSWSAGQHEIQHTIELYLNFKAAGLYKDCKPVADLH